MLKIDRRSVIALGIGAVAPLAVSSKAAAHHLDVRNVLMFGAKGNGVTDDTDAIQAAINDAEIGGGGVVRIPAGTYLVTSTIQGKARVHIVGEGIGCTVVKRADFTEAMHVFGFTGISQFSIRDLTVDGNWKNTSGGHGIRPDNVSEFYIGNVRIIDAGSYGIGLQAHYDYKRGIIENVWIERSGSDGIDIKNRISGNEALILNNIIIVDPGMRGHNKAGLDIRGPCHLSNITVLFKTVANNATGIRFRFGVEGVANGLGGKDSTLSNFYVKAEPTLSGTIGYGVDVGHERVKIANGTIVGAIRGMIVWGDARQCVIKGVSASNGRHGFEDRTADNTWIGCDAYDNTYDGFRLHRGTGITLIACRSSGNQTDWRLNASVLLLGPLNYPYVLPLANGMGVRQALLGTTKSPVNFLRLDGGAAAAAPVLSAQGADSNIDITLLPKGSGRVRFGPFRATGNATITGFVEVKDSGGNIRKLAVVS